MKNRIIIGIALLLFIAPRAFSQTTIKGTVTDNEGNPIPGVKVEAVGTGAYTLTELDGRYSLPVNTMPGKIKVYYVGMETKTMPAASVTDFSMNRRKSIWTFRPETWQVFAEVNVGFSDDGFQHPSYGLTIGAVKNWGVYLKGMIHAGKGLANFYNSALEPIPHDQKDLEIAPGPNRTYDFKALLAGCMWRMSGPLYLNVGAGIMQKNIAYLGQMKDLGGTASYYYGRWEHKEDVELGVELGLTLRLKNVAVSAGTFYEATGDSHLFVPTVGLGYFF